MPDGVSAIRMGYYMRVAGDAALFAFIPAY